MCGLPLQSARPKAIMRLLRLYGFGRAGYQPGESDNFRRAFVVFFSIDEQAGLVNSKND